MQDTPELSSQTAAMVTVMESLNQIVSLEKRLIDFVWLPLGKRLADLLGAY